MADWWDRLFNPDAYYGTPDGGRSARLDQLAADLDALDIWRLPSVVAARELVADTTAMMQMVAVAGVDRLDPAPPIIRRPDPTEPYRRTIERIVNSMTRHGRAWLYVDAVGANGHPIALHVVDDRRVNATLDQSCRIKSATVDGVPVDVDRLRHIPLIVDDDRPLGASPLERIRTSLEQLAEVYRFSANYYTTAAVPPYAVVHPNRLTATQADAFADQWLSARAERRPAILSSGIEIKTYTAQTAADALLLDAIAYLDATAARVMQIPPSLLNTESYTSLTYANAQSEFARWLAVGLYPMFLARIEAAFSDFLPRGQTAVFDTSNLTRMDFAARMDAMSTSIAAGIHTPAEARALEGLPAVPSLDPVPIQPNIEGL